MQLTIWRHFQVQTPDDWEMLQYSTDPDDGRCYFADRYQHRLVLHWHALAAPPDLARMASDYRARIEQNEDVTDVEEVSYFQWQGAVATLPDASYATFAAYFPEERCLIELTFLTPGPREVKLEQRMLQSVRLEPVSAQGYRRWRAFGMEMLVDDTLTLRECSALPASAKLTFGTEKDSQRQEIFERLGMVSAWMTDTSAAWLRKHLPREVTVREETEASFHDHAFAVLIGDQSALGAARLLGRRIPYRARAWVCPTDGRLYAVLLSGGAAEDAAPPLRDRLICCERMR